VNLYEVLDVSRTASPDEVRAAYRRAARAHHPDAHGDAAADRMAAVNAAWHVLGNAQRRAEYDRTLRVPGTQAPPPQPTRPSSPPPREPKYNPLARYQNPPRFPWRPMLVIGVVAAVLVLVVSAIGTDPAEPPPVDHIMRIGDCVRFESNGDATEVRCTDQHDGVVETLVPLPEECRPGTEVHRDRQGMGMVCVVPG